MTNKSCARCEKTVYPIEELKCLDKVWHKTCFKCHECGMILNMKTYKGFNKLPYCNAHCPQARATTVAETPESRRLAENTKIQSNIKYHEDFERQKGKLTQVADDPETLRIRNTSKIISNATYHGEYEKKKQMEERRTLLGAGDDNAYNNNINAAVYHQYSSSSSSTTATNMNNNNSNNNNNNNNNQTNILNKNQQQQYVKTPIANTSMNMDNHLHHQKNQMMYANNNNNTLNQTDISNKNYYSTNNNTKLSGNIATNASSSTQKVSPSGYYPVHPHQQDNAPRTGIGYQQSQYSGLVHPGQMQQQPVYPQSQQQNYSPKHVQQQHQMPKSQNLQYQQQQQKSYYHPVVVQDTHPQMVIYPTSNYENHHHTQQQYRTVGQQQQLQQIVPHHQQQQQQQLKSTGMARQNLGLCFRAIYDYTAQDVDEVTFMDGDLIVHCQPIDDGWMTGTVQRTGETGMLPSNYVEAV